MYIISLSFYLYVYFVYFYLYNVLSPRKDKMEEKVRKENK